jgi:hypothetical protein
MSQTLRVSPAKPGILSVTKNIPNIGRGELQNSPQRSDRRVLRQMHPVIASAVAEIPTHSGFSLDIVAFRSSFSVAQNSRQHPTPDQ